MIYKFTDVDEKRQFMEVFANNNKRTVTFQTVTLEGVVSDVQISKENLYSLIGCLLTIQSDFKKIDSREIIHGALEEVSELTLGQIESITGKPEKRKRIQNG